MEDLEKASNIDCLWDSVGGGVLREWEYSNSVIVGERSATCGGCAVKVKGKDHHYHVSYAVELKNTEL